METKLKTPECVLEARRRHYQENRAAILARHKAWREKNREAVLERKKAANKRYLEKKKQGIEELKKECELINTEEDEMEEIFSFLKSYFGFKKSKEKEAAEASKQ